MSLLLAKKEKSNFQISKRNNNSYSWLLIEKIKELFFLLCISGLYLLYEIIFCIDLQFVFEYEDIFTKILWMIFVNVNVGSKKNTSYFYS